MLNYDKLYNVNRMNVLEQLSSDISQLVIMRASYMFYLNQHYMACSDFSDYMDMGKTPPEDAENVLRLLMRYLNLMEIICPYLKKNTKRLEHSRYFLRLIHLIA